MSFDRLAPHYDWLEAITAGGKLQRVRTVWLEELRGCRRILSVGEGHGRFAAACARRFPEAELTCVEASPRMLDRARRRVGDGAGKIRWICSDIETWQPPPEKFDAIVTCFFLDCFPPDQLEFVVAKLAGCAEPEAVWIIADFAIPERGFARWRARFVHALMYSFFRFATKLPARHMTPPAPLLARHGFEQVGRHDFNLGLLRATLHRRSPIKGQAI